MLVSCGGSDPDASGRELRVDGGRYLLPAGWHSASRSLTPHLTNPRELLSAGTGRLPAGGECAHMPSAALRAMRASDVLVTVQERLGSPASFAPRPAHFRASGETRSEAQDCAGPRPQFASYWFGFRDGGRGFHVLVAVGRSASKARRQRAFALLDSLRISPRRAVRIDGDDALPYDSGARGLSLVHPSAWSVYPGALTQAISARNQIALGTFALRQRRPDANCSPVTAQRARRASDGFVFLFEYEGLNPRQLARFPRRPRRLRLPRQAAAFECFGDSRLVRFRDAGRAFQAHVYGPPRRRREALAILDSLRVRPAPFDARIHAARFPAAAGWRTRVSRPGPRGSCVRQRASWASTVPFSDPPLQLPPHDMVASMKVDDVVIAALQYTQCRRALPGMRALRPPLRLEHATRSQFPGPRGDELALYRLLGRFAGRYYLDVWVFYGRPHPTAAQRRAAQRELARVRWPASL
ncbi:MAG: hypothetical protein QOE31_3984 [Solirubrobacteraceae bacterium]|nr:hypothetical protein [Solirubrobacteraceae bacterium]